MGDVTSGDFAWPCTPYIVHVPEHLYPLAKKRIFLYSLRTVGGREGVKEYQNIVDFAPTHTI